MDGWWNDGRRHDDRYGSRVVADSWLVLVLAAIALVKYIRSDGSEITVLQTMRSSGAASGDSLLSMGLVWGHFVSC